MGPVGMCAYAASHDGTASRAYTCIDVTATRCVCITWGSCASVTGRRSMLMSRVKAQYGEPPPTQHSELPHNEHPHPSPHPPHQHNEHEHLPTRGEWTNFLFAMLEGDTSGSIPGWYELGASVSPSSPVSGPGEPQPGFGSVMGMGTLGSALSLLQGVNTLSVPQTVGEANSTLRFALG